MKKLIFTALMVCMCVGVQAAKKASDSPLAAYLMVYHKDADHSLHMALSRDGYSWKALKGDKAVVSGDTIAQQRGIRDPHITEEDAKRLENYWLTSK